MKKKFKLGTTLVLLFFAFSCSNGMFMKYMNNQPPKSAVSDDGKDEEFEETVPEGKVKFSANFKYILPNGEIDPSYKGDINALRAKFPPAHSAIPSEEYNTRLFKIAEIDNNNKADISLVNDSSKTWEVSDAIKNEKTYAGSDFKSKGQSTSEIKYLLYEEKNPFFSSTSVYNTVAFKKVDNSLETVMKRFKFFRWKGKGGGVVALDNYMIALDTHTGLIFPFIKIISWKELLGENIPQGYAPIEKYLGSDGKTHKFYEYDPSGYIDTNGKVIYEPWFLEASSKDLQTQLDAKTPITGKSPYYNDGSEEIEGIVKESGGYPVTGTLTVTAKYFKNIDMTGSVALVIFKQDDAKFDYKIGAAGFAGEESDSPETTILVTETGIQRKKGTQSDYSASKQFGFVGEERTMRLDLDAYVKRVNGDALTVAELKKDSGIPSTFIYNRSNQTWEYPSGFKLGIGQTKDFTITYQTTDGFVQLCYTLAWTSTPPVSDKGKIVIPFIASQTSDTQLTVTGESTEYSLEYVDADNDSASTQKNVALSVELFNLDSSSAVTVSSTVSGASGFIKNVQLAGTTIVRRGGIHGTAAIPVTFTLGSDPWNTQNGEIKLNIIYPTVGYDKGFSPKQIVFTIKREISKSP